MLLCGRLGSKCFRHLNSFRTKPYNISVLVIPISLMRKLRHRKVRKQAHGYSVVGQGCHLQALVPEPSSQPLHWTHLLRFYTLFRFYRIQKWKKPGPWYTRLQLISQQPNQITDVEHSDILGKILTVPLKIQSRAYLIHNLPTSLSAAYHSQLIIRHLDRNPGLTHWRIEAKS